MGKKSPGSPVRPGPRPAAMTILPNSCRIQPEMPHDTYESPLAARNASKEMLRLFSPQHKFGLWRRLWVELARAERELGITRISEEAIAQMSAKLDDIDFAR